MSGSGLGFGVVAEAYERHRPGYTEELVDAVLAHAVRPVLTALEVGAGTGKATRVFARRGIRVIAVEPDPAMAAVLTRSSAGLPVDVRIGTFEGVEGAGEHDLIYAAAAWHWTDPATRWSRTARLLRPGGVLALFGRPSGLVNAELEATVDAVEARFLAPESQRPGHPWTADQLRAASGFTDVVERRLPESTALGAEGYLGRLGTASAYLALDEPRREALYAELRAVLPPEVEIDATTELVLARRA